MSHATATPSFVAVVEDERAPIYRYARSLVRDPHLAEDVTSLTFERAMRAWDRFDPARAHPRTWLRQIAHNVAVEQWRAGARRERVVERLTVREAGACEDPLPAGISPALREALSVLSPRERQLVALRVLLDVPTADAAAQLEISVTAATTMLSRALAKVRAALGTTGEALAA